MKCLVKAQGFAFAMADSMAFPLVAIYPFHAFYANVPRVSPRRPVLWELLECGYEVAGDTALSTAYHKQPLRVSLTARRIPPETFHKVRRVTLCQTQNVLAMR